MASKNYDFNLAAALNASQRFDVRGNYCKLTAATGAVIVRADTGEEWALLAGQGFRVPDGAPFRALTIRNATAAANTGTLFIGDSSFEDSRITGSVFIIDSSREKVLAGTTFIGCMSQGGGGLPTRVQLQNPVGSGKNIWVSAMTVGLSASEAVGVTLTDTLFAQSNGSAALNLNPAGPAPVALLRYDDFNVAITAGRNIRLGYCTANQDRVILFPNPVMIPPGKGMYVVGANSTTVLRVSFEFEEYAA